MSKPAIVQINTHDIGGGAANVCRNLFHAFRDLEHKALLIVGTKRSELDDVIQLEHEKHRNGWARLWASFGRPGYGNSLLRKLYWLGQPMRLARCLLGIEDFDYPATRHITDCIPAENSILHCHNLHGGYFDLRALPALSRQLPVFLTLHDAWLLSGHCVHSLTCERWKTGCGDCPDLSLPQPIRRDRSGSNWGRKRQIYAQSRLYVASPSQWLMDKVNESILMPGIVEQKVIPNGVDLSLFSPGDKLQIRGELDLSRDAKIILYAGYRVRNNPWKDYATVATAFREAAACLAEEALILLVMGEAGSSETVGRSQIRFLPYETDVMEVARYYKAADLYVHASTADTFPTSVIEALACGTPVIATAVGGIPEQVKGLQPPMENGWSATLNSHDSGTATGILAEPKDHKAMAQAMIALLSDSGLSARLAENAVNDAQARFDLRQQVARYLEWYNRVLRGDEKCS